MSKFHPFGGQTYTLGSSIGSTDTSILLSSFLEPVTGTPYTMALLNTDIAFGTIAPKTTQSEFISFTGITQNSNGTATLTGVVRGLAKKYPFTTSSSYKLPHSGQTQFIISDAPQLFEEYAVLVNNNVFTGYNTVPDPLNMTDIANKEWVLSVVNGGTVSVNSIIVTGNAGETLVAGNLVYLKISNGQWYKTVGTSEATLAGVQLGIAQGAGSANGIIAVGVMLRGLDANNTGTTGVLAYAGNTAGSISSSTGTVSKVVGQYVISNQGLYFNPEFYNLLTPTQVLAMAGSQGTPSGTNKFITQDNVYDADTDQTQVTQNSFVEFGMANSTGQKNKIQQSFIPAKTKTRGVKLYKSADTGTFTGTVTVALYADSAGSPTGGALATQTLTNVQWLALPVGEFEIDFSAEYSMTAGTLYWIQAITSTADNSNHPNLGDNTAGGYANGSVKYWNTTDGYVAIANIDLYFKTLQGVSSQIGYTSASPVVRTYTNANVGSTTTRFDISNTSGTTYRYTYDGTGTDPVISTTTFPVGSYFGYYNVNGNVNNNGTFVVTNSSTNYVEVTNASGVAEVDKVIGDGYVTKGSAWTKPAGLKYIEVELQAGGAGGTASNTSAGGGGGGGGYAKKLIAATSLNSTVYLISGSGGPGQSYNNPFALRAGSSYFSSSVYATGGVGTAYSSTTGGAGGVGTGGDINISGGNGGYGTQPTANFMGGYGGGSLFSPVTPPIPNNDGVSAIGYGGGGSGGAQNTGTHAGGAGSAGIIIVKEYYY